MTRSESINELATALAKAQGEIEGASKTAENPHFRSKYADLAAVWDACREPLSRHGLSVVQLPRLVAIGEASWMVECETLILHTSGQFIGETWAVPVTQVSAHGCGSALTYSRRQSLMALVGIAPEDDDANAAVGPVAGAVRKPARTEQRGVATVKVLGIVIRPSNTPGELEKFIITADDKATYQTFIKAHAGTAKAAQEAAMPVEIKYRQESFGRVIESIAERDAVEPPL